MDKGHHNEAAACEVERRYRSLPEAFESGCFVTEGVCTSIQQTNTWKHLKPRSGRKHGAGLEFYPPYSISICANIATRLFYGV